MLTTEAELVQRYFGGQDFRREVWLLLQRATYGLKHFCEANNANYDSQKNMQEQVRIIHYM